MECLIDLEDFDRINSMGYSINASYHADVDTYYVKMTVYVGIVNGKPKYKIPYLHRIIMNANENQEVDHKYHNGLDNRKRNLKITDGSRNSRNRKGANVNNSTGYRNVTYIKRAKKPYYLVQLYIEGKNIRLGKFETAEEAASFAEKMREKYFGVQQ